MLLSIMCVAPGGSINGELLLFVVYFKSKSNYIACLGCWILIADDVRAFVEIPT